MDFRDKGSQTQLRNIEARTGRSLVALQEEVVGYGAIKHAEKRARLQQVHGLSFVHADTLLLWIEANDGSAQHAIDSIYAGAKAALRPIHDAFMARVAGLGHFEAVPKKGYVSLRVAKQFCMIGPTTKTRVDLGINARGVSPTDRLRALPPGRLCSFEVSLVEPSDIDNELLSWVHVAREQALAKGGR